ncbi:hypothetical protein INF37_09630 [Pseudoflavonifractor sp. DSM 107456]|uniref:Uncharacterized protein n=1 Tax=Pseudoflavonifractor gallinarum TaxID=2779352 RepID=A0ABR9RC50_9FIRM|nr:hypothetical protein [Pseudoflavonifractor gallinarum]MBE5056257.1 hypothetical protein [Pseudoflavonifractor gallinarum]
MELDKIFTIISLVIALLSVCVSVYSVHQSRKSALTGAFFSEMTQAYSDYLRCVSEFVFRRGTSERDALAAALYRLQLFASKEISVDAQELYVFVLDWASSNPVRALSVDERMNNLGHKMRVHLDQARKRGCF